MLILHDIGEITVGDSHLYDAGRPAAQNDERSAVKELFSSLPEDTRAEFTSLWEEFANDETPEAHYARAIDRFQPFLSNLANDGGSWKTLKISKVLAFSKNNQIAKGSEFLWDVYKTLADEADKDGFFVSSKQT